MKTKSLTLGFSLLIVLFFSLFSSAAFAQEEPKSKFYDFDDMLIDGQLKKPDLFQAGAKDSAKFSRLLSLKRSFLVKVRESTAEDALK